MIVEDLKKSILNLLLLGKYTSSNNSASLADNDLEIIKNEKEKLIENNVIPKDNHFKPISEAEREKYNVPSNWQIVRFQDVATVITDYVANGSFKTLRENTNRSKTNQYAIFVRTVDLSNDFNTDLVYIDKNSYEFLSKSKLYGGELILPNIGGSIGKTFILPNFDKPMSLAPNSILVKFNNDITKYYYKFFFDSEIGKKLLLGDKGGTATPKFSKTDLRKLIVPFPPIEEQQRIVDKIEELFAKLDEINPLEEELNKLKISFPNDMRKSIYREAITGSLVKNNPLEQIENSDKIKRKFNINIPYKIPNNWIWVSHNDLFEIVGGSQPPKSKFSDKMQSGYIQLYQTRDYGPNPQPVYVDKTLVSKFTNSGDIILARYGGSLGKVFIAKDGAYNVALAKVVIKYPNLINNKYLFYYYHADLYQNKVKSGNRSAQAGFSKNDLNDLPFPLPPLEEQQRIVDKIEELLPLCDDVERIVNE